MAIRDVCYVTMLVAEKEVPIEIDLDDLDIDARDLVEPQFFSPLLEPTPSHVEVGTLRVGVEMADADKPGNDEFLAKEVTVSAMTELDIPTKESVTWTADDEPQVTSEVRVGKGELRETWLDFPPSILGFPVPFTMDPQMFLELTIIGMTSPRPTFTKRMENDLGLSAKPRNMAVNEIADTKDVGRGAVVFRMDAPRNVFEGNLPSLRATTHDGLEAGEQEHDGELEVSTADKVPVTLIPTFREVTPDSIKGGSLGRVQEAFEEPGPEGNELVDSLFHPALLRVRFRSTAKYEFGKNFSTITEAAVEIPASEFIEIIPVSGKDTPVNDRDRGLEEPEIFS